MPNQSVTFLLVVKTEKGWRRMPVVFEHNGKLRPHHALVNSNPEHFPGLYYTLRHFEGAKTVWTLLNGNRAIAILAHRRIAPAAEWLSRG